MAGYSTQIVRSVRTGIYGAPDRFSYSLGYQDVAFSAGATGAAPPTPSVLFAPAAE